MRAVIRHPHLLRVGLAALALTSTTAACQNRTPPNAGEGLERATITGTKLELANEAGSCTVRAVAGNGRKSHYKLGVPWPCRFAVAEPGTVQSISFSAAAAATLIANSQPNADGKTCQTSVQGIVIAGDTILVSSRPAILTSCGHGPFDEGLLRKLATNARTD